MAANCHEKKADNAEHKSKETKADEHTYVILMALEDDNKQAQKAFLNAEIWAKYEAGGCKKHPDHESTPA
jgi:hypothetical protein